MKITNCKYCNSSNLKFIETPESVHYGKMECGNCKRFLHWVKNPDSVRTTTRVNKKTVREVCNFHKLNNEFCFMCLRTREQLGWSETLTIDHIKELDKGGEDQIWNMQILCSACHKLKNWCRLYMNWHLNKKGDEDDSKTITNS